MSLRPGKQRKGVATPPEAAETAPVRQAGSLGDEKAAMLVRWSLRGSTPGERARMLVIDRAIAGGGAQ